ncbi:MAG TPA: SRPBCC domain-containing protein [Puia sp.]|nr:SRPBCC domain-containing protein [Puia sp.]
MIPSNPKCGTNDKADFKKNLRNRTAAHIFATNRLHKETIKKTKKMKNDLPLDLTVDKATKTVYINREFDAPLSLVWDAYTKQELLDQWWAPEPMVSKTKFMNFEVGGRRFYAMVSPDGQERWSIQRYTSITPKTNFKMRSTFSDKDENPEPSGSDWDFKFGEQNGMTKVSITIYNESLTRLEKMIEMGFGEGCAMQFKNLEKLLATLSHR